MLSLYWDLHMSNHSVFTTTVYLNDPVRSQFDKPQTPNANDDYFASMAKTRPVAVIAILWDAKYWPDSYC